MPKKRFAETISKLHSRQIKLQVKWFLIQTQGWKSRIQKIAHKATPIKFLSRNTSTCQVGCSHSLVGVLWCTSSTMQVCLSARYYNSIAAYPAYPFWQHVPNSPHKYSLIMFTQVYSPHMFAAWYAVLLEARCPTRARRIASGSSGFIKFFRAASR